MSLKVGELYGTLGLDDQEFNSKLDKSKSKFGNIATSLVGISAKAAVGIGAAMAGGAILSTKSFIDFEGQMNEVFTLLPGITKDAMGDMTSEVKDFAKEFGTLPKEVVPALYQSISAGVPKDNVFSFLEVAQKAATGGVTQLETAVDGISSVVNAYGDDVVDATKASDLMFTAVKLGKTNFEELSGSLYNVIPTASALGVEFGDVTAAMAAMTAQGTPTSVATTQMRQMLVELSKDGGKTSDTFKEIAGKSFKDFISEGGNVQQALQMLEQAAAENNIGINDLFGSVEAGNAALALTGKGTEKFSESLSEMANSAGATDTAFETMDQGIGRTMDKIKANISAIALDLAETWAPAVANATDIVLEYMPQIQSAVETAFNAVGAVINWVTEYVIPPMMTAIQTLRQWWEENGAGILSSTQGTFQSIIDFIMPIIMAIVTFIQEKLEVLRQFWDENGQQIMEATQNAFNIIKNIIEFVMPFVEMLIIGIWENIKGVFDGALNIIMGLLKTFAGIFTGDWDKLWEGIKQIFSGLVEGLWNLFQLFFLGKIIKGVGIFAGKFVGAIKNWVSSVFKKVDDLVAGITGKLGNLWGKAKDWGANMVKGFIDGIKSKISAAVDTAKGLMNSVKSFIGFNSPAEKGEGRYIEDWGANMIDGFLDGAKSMIPAAKASIDDVVGNMNVNPIIKSPRMGTHGVSGTSAQSSNPITLILELDGRQITRTILPHMQKEIRIKTGG